MDRKQWQVLSGLVLALALALRLPLLGGSFWLDEAAQALESVRPWWQQLDIIPDFQPPLIHLIIHLVQYFGQQEWWLRTWAALIPGMITIWLTIQIGPFLNKKRGRQIGLLAGLLLAISSFHIFYSQELRPYSLPALWVTASWWVILKPRLNHRWIWLSSLTVLGLYSSYLYPFAILGQLAYLVTRGRQLISSLKSFAVSGLLTLPLVPLLLNQLKQGQSIRSQIPNWESVVSLPQLKALTLMWGKLLFGVFDLAIEPSFILISGLVLATALILYKSLKNKKALMPILIWMVIPILTAWLFSFLLPVFRPKRLLFVFPAWSLLFSWLILVDSKKLNLLKKILLSTLIAVSLYSTWSYMVNPKLQRENWRSLTAEIQKNYDPQSTLVIQAFDDQFASWKWYNQDRVPTWTSGQLSLSAPNGAVDLLPDISHLKTIVLFSYLTDLTDPDQVLKQEIEKKNFEISDTITYPLIGQTFIYENRN